MAELKLPFIGHGGDYNPDQWRDRPDILAEDIRLMKLARCNLMSVGIFAWATLEHFQRTRGVLRLYFYPKDMTGGCTSQACNFRDRYPQFQEKGAVVLGVSKDTVESHKRFEEKHGLPFPLLADTELKVITAYPIILTRDMAKAKKWLHEKVRGTERTGVLVTKESARYKPLVIHILPSGDENAVHWFLEDKADTRSSNYLEDAATEIQVQGLELDYTCLLWDADMRYENGRWRFYRFNGQTRWVEQTATSESKQEQQKYILNAYRVLLTRARSGMVICVPEGNPNKTTKQNNISSICSYMNRHLA